MHQSFETQVLLQRYRKNYLIHGNDFLRGDDTIPIYQPHVIGLPAWRPVPDASTPSHSRAHLSETHEGHILLDGYYARADAGLSRIEGRLSTDPVAALGQGICGLGSTCRWKWDMSLHQWLEVRFRTDGRAYELILQASSRSSFGELLWRVPLPRGPAPPRRATGTAGGPYAILGVERDASADAIRSAYHELAKEAHPDRASGSEERFKALSRAYALVSDEKKRALYDELGEGDVQAVSEEFGEWRTLKVPFTAFRDRTLYHNDNSERIDSIYLLNTDDTPGPVRLELASVSLGRCNASTNYSTGEAGRISCEMGFCECGYYNGWRVEPFVGPFAKGEPPPPGTIEWGWAVHHEHDVEA